MNAWSLSGSKELSLRSYSKDASEGYAKVKITVAGITSNDIDIYSGSTDVNYPMIIGRCGVGVISEVAEGETDFKKGDRVAISPYFSCGNCLNCRKGNTLECTNLTTGGLNADGFLRDFAVLPNENLYHIPDRLTDEQAIFIPYVAYALSVLDIIECEIGTFVGIGSAGVLGNILAQLVLYYQAIPLVFDKRARYLDYAKQVGVYYTFNNDTSTPKMVQQLTSGRMSANMVYIKKVSTKVDDMFSYLQNGGEIAIAAISTHSNYNVFIPMMEVLNHNTKITPIRLTNDNIITAINLLTNGSIDIKPMLTCEVDYYDVEDFFKKQSVMPENEVFFMCKVNI